MFLFYWVEVPFFHCVVEKTQLIFEARCSKKHCTISCILSFFFVILTDKCVLLVSERDVFDKQSVS